MNEKNKNEKIRVIEEDISKYYVWVSKEEGRWRRKRRKR